MKKLASILLTVCAVALLSVSCDPKSNDKQSLSVSPVSLAFEASVNQAKQVTVIAENVEWSFEVISTASEWLEAKKEGNGLAVTVKDNTRAESRSGIIKVIPESSDLPVKEITVSQKGSSDPVTLEILLSPTSLSFKSENTEPQEVTVTMRGEGFTWEAKPDDADKEWINVVTQDGKIIVTVVDNPLTKERSGMINVVPSEKGIAAKTVLVNQEGKVEPPSLSVDKTDGLTFTSRDKKDQVIKVNPVNCNWGVAARDENGAGVTWVTLKKNNTDKERSVVVTVDPNTSEERVGYVVLTALDKVDNKPIENVPVVKVKITQAKGRPAVSTLEKDVEFTAANYGSLMYAHMYWDTKAPNTSTWQLDFADGSFKINKDGWPYFFEGTGNRLFIEMHSPKMLINKEGVYKIPVDKDYDIFVKDNAYIDSPEYTFDSGRENYGQPINGVQMSEMFPNGTWYMSVENGVVTALAPIVEGTLKIENINKFIYKITLTGMDDAGNTIKMSFQGDMEEINQPNGWMDDPSLTPEEPEEPEVPPFGPPASYRR